METGTMNGHTSFGFRRSTGASDFFGAPDSCKVPPIPWVVEAFPDPHHSQRKLPDRIEALNFKSFGVFLRPSEGLEAFRES